MCSVRLLIRTVRTAICTSGDPESESARRYSWINSRFRSLVTVIASRRVLHAGGRAISAVQYDDSPSTATDLPGHFLDTITKTTSRSMYQCGTGLQGRVAA